MLVSSNWLTEDMIHVLNDKSSLIIVIYLITYVSQIILSSLYHWIRQIYQCRIQQFKIHPTLTYL